MEVVEDVAMHVGVLPPEVGSVASAGAGGRPL